ncbi:phosphoribosyltransferase [Syncephalis fuscata]|nr:phosphoribosyltransferase [Syncephalis fuscata]
MLYNQNICFKDRVDAGQQLADRLMEKLSDVAPEDIVVLALPRGGVPVASIVAQRLGAPLDVCLVRKLGVPGHEELAFGAIAEGDFVVYNDGIRQAAGIDDSIAEEVKDRKLAEINRREQIYRQGKSPPSIINKTVIIVDDGIATGATMRVACQSVRSGHPKQLIVAAPVGAPESCQAMAKLADRVICLTCPTYLSSIGRFYDDFTQTTNEQVTRLLATAHAHHPFNTSA